MSATPYFICIGLLAGLSLFQLAILTLRELHHNRIQAGLIDKILEQHGLNAIPKEHPLAELVQRIEKKADEPENPPQRTRHEIPGMAAFAHEYNRVMKIKDKTK